MANIWFDSPQNTSPPTDAPLVSLAQTSWSLTAEDRKLTDPVVTLTASPPPEKIEPNDHATLTRGYFVAIPGTTGKTFTVTYPSTVVTPFNATLTVGLHLDGDPTGTPDKSEPVTVRVQFGSSGGELPPGGGSPGGRADPAALATATGDDARPVVLTGRILAHGEHAAAVVCVIYRKPDGRMIIDFANRARFLPKHFFSVVFDPAAREQRRCYQLNWVDELGQILKVTSDPVPPT